jgi:hypothetical protein
LGVKVRKYFEGYDTPFLGSVVNFFANVGLYEIKYDDGDGEQMTEELVDRFVLPTSIPAEAAKIIQQEEKKKRQEEEARRIEQEANIVPEDPEKFIGTTVSKRHKTYDGQETEIGGSVAAYFSDKKRFRVKYSNGLYEDLTYHELQKCIEASDALRMQKSTEQFSSLASPSSRKRSREFSSDDEEQEEIKNNEPPAKQPMHSINSTSMNSMSQQNDSSQIRKTINESKLPTKETAYLALRHTLLLILQQNAVKTFHTPKQLTILKNEDLKVSVCVCR